MIFHCTKLRRPLEKDSFICFFFFKHCQLSKAETLSRGKETIWYFIQNYSFVLESTWMVKLCPVVLQRGSSNV